MKATKEQENKLTLAIEKAIDNYIEAGCKDFFLTSENYDFGYEVKLSIRKNKKLKR